MKSQYDFPDEISAIESTENQADSAEITLNIDEKQKSVYNLIDNKPLALVSRNFSGEPCYNNCGLMGTWIIEIDTDFRQLFCDNCFKIAKADLLKNGYDAKLKGVEDSQ